MEPKPKGWARDYAAAFEAQSVASRYGLRPPYPAETFERLAALATGTWNPTIDALLDSHHSQSSFVVEQMRDPDGFDREVAAAVEELAPRAGDGYALTVKARISWGRPVG